MVMFWHLTLQDQLSSIRQYFQYSHIMCNTEQYFSYRFSLSINGDGATIIPKHWDKNYSSRFLRAKFNLPCRSRVFPFYWLCFISGSKKFTHVSSKMAIRKVPIVFKLNTIFLRLQIFYAQINMNIGRILMKSSVSVS